MSYLRSASLRGFRAVVTELDGEPERLVSLAGMPRECIDLDDLLIPAGRAAALLELAAEQLDCPDLGLRMARLQSVSVLGPLALAMTNSRSIGDALECLTRYLSVHSRALALRIGEDPHGDPQTAAIFYSPANSNGPVQAVDLGMGFIHRVITYLNRGAYDVRGLELPYRPAASLSAYRAHFGTADVRVEQRYPAAVLRLPAKLAERPLSGVNETLRELAVAFLTEQAGSYRGSRMPRGNRHDELTQVQTAVRESLGTGPTELGGVARLMHVHPRTLQRRLAESGTTFGRIVDEARRETALRLVIGTDVPLGQIAAMVGFNNQSAFTRAAHRWWQAPPAAIRRGADLD